MCLAQNTKIGKLKVGRLTDYSKGILRELKDMFRIKFKIETSQNDNYENNEENQPDNVPNGYMLSCVGYSMYNKNRIEVEM